MRFVLILFSILPFIGNASSLDSVRLEKRVNGLFVIHEVDEKETLYSISRRYGGSVALIKEHNALSTSDIEIGQLLSVQIGLDSLVASEEPLLSDGYHVVEKGETLYGIAKKYELTLENLKKLNGLIHNDISLGQQLIVVDSTSSAEIVQVDAGVKNGNDGVEIDSLQTATESYQIHYVQRGETLRSIAEAKRISLDSLKSWNELNTDRLKIGQQLKFRDYLDSLETDSIAQKTQLNVDGFERIYQEGIASVIADISTRKYLALHPSLPIGTELEVRNLMNNLIVHVKVVGKLPATGLNKDLMVRLSQPAFDQLGILDPKARVVVSYFKE